LHFDNPGLELSRSSFVESRVYWRIPVGVRGPNPDRFVVVGWNFRELLLLLLIVSSSSSNGSAAADKEAKMDV
jgi:hypothetical protein